jgi:drug/metabolite transporter (DMT)-like permease
MVLLAFAAVYLIWGSTYLAIRVAVETLPPFLLGGARFTLAGIVLIAFLKLRGVGWPTWVQGRNSLLAGAVMLLGGNGLVVWAEQYVTSSFAALFIASAPVWFAVLDWARPGGQRPAWHVWLGISLGLAGVGLLVLRREAGVGQIHLGGALALLLATMSWASGSMLAKHTAKPQSSWMSAGLQMLGGGLAMLVAAVGGPPDVWERQVAIGFVRQQLEAAHAQIAAKVGFDAAAHRRIDATRNLGLAVEEIRQSRRAS